MRWARWFATGFGVGYFPVLPGTAGSLLGCLLFVPLRALSFPLYSLLLVLLFGLGVYASTRSEGSFGKKDANEIVIDEVVAMMFVLFLLPASLGWWIAGFAAFRLFDISKPPPIHLLEKLPAGWGVMADDLMAGGYAVVSLRIVELFLQSGRGG